MGGKVPMITVEELLQKDHLLSLTIPFLNLASDEDDEYFFVRSAYRQSQECSPTETEMSTNNHLLIDESELPFYNESTARVGKHVLKIKKSAEITNRQQFFDALYKQIQMKRLTIDPEDFERDLIISLFALRGSIDSKFNYFAVDVLKENQSKEYLFQLFNLLTSISDIKQLNLNFRELQEQYVTGKVRRNTQIRINLRWFYDHYRYDLKTLNIYKYRILETHSGLINTFNIQQTLKPQFIERMMFYIDTVYESLSKQRHISIMKGKVEEYRSILDFGDPIENQEILQRSQNIRQLAVALLPDECVGCKDDYPLEDRTFKYRNSDRYYLEIHHVIPFSTDKSGDQLENLVKLCPACHRALTKGRAEKTYQKQLIRNILKHSLTASHYVGLLMEQPYTENDKVNFIYEKLQ